MSRKKNKKVEVAPEFRKNCVIYARRSDSRKQQEQSNEAQIKDCTEFARRQGLNVIEVYTEAHTGTNDDREQFKAIKDRAKRQDFAYLLVWKFDRFARNQQDTYAAMGYFGAYGVSIISVTEMTSLTPTPQDNLLTGIYIAMAEYFSEELAIKVNRGMLYKAQQGLSVGGGTTYGYKLGSDGKYVIDEDAAFVVKEIFEKYVSGMGTKEICEHLKSLGIKNGRGADFNINGMRYILKNPKYTGLYTFAGTNSFGEEEVVNIKDGLPRIISDELFEQAQKKLAENSRAPAKNKAEVPYALTGKCFCGLCGTSMHGVSGKKKYYYYACHKRYKDKKSCDLPNFPKDALEIQVAAYVMSFIRSDDNIRRMIRHLNNALKFDDKKAEVNSLKKRLKAETANKEKIFQKFIDTDNALVQKECEKRLEHSQEIIENLSARIASFTAKYRPRVLMEEDIKLWIDGIAILNINDVNDRRHLISRYVERVDVFEDYIEVTLVRPDADKVSGLIESEEADKTTYYSPEEEPLSTIAKGEEPADYMGLITELYSDYKDNYKNYNEYIDLEPKTDTDEDPDDPDDDPNPKGPKGSGRGSGNGKSTSGRKPPKSAKPDNNGNNGTNNKSAEHENGSRSARIGSPRAALSETSLSGKASKLAFSRQLKLTTILSS